MLCSLRFLLQPGTLAGSTNHAKIEKIDSNENSLGILQVCQGDILEPNGLPRYQTSVFNRGYEDKNIVYDDEVSELRTRITDLENTINLLFGS